MCHLVLANDGPCGYLLILIEQYLIQLSLLKISKNVSSYLRNIVAVLALRKKSQFLKRGILWEIEQL